MIFVISVESICGHPPTHVNPPFGHSFTSSDSLTLFAWGSFPCDPPETVADPDPDPLSVVCFSLHLTNWPLFLGRASASCFLLAYLIFFEKQRVFRF